MDNSDTTIHVVPNAHLDIAWLWDWREGLNEGIATCRTIGELMEENPDITFARNEAFIYEHIERYDPDLFARIKSLVEEGRWEVAGGAMLQPDTNLGCGEAYVRQYLYGQKYFKSRFNIIPEVAYQVDSFGHAAGLPGIYRAAGCRFAVQCRPSQAEYSTSSRVFRWRGPDGSEILTANLESYGLEFESNDPEYTISARIARAVEQKPENLPAWVLLVGLGDHGGGLNKQIVRQIREHIQNPPDGCSIRFSTLKSFFSEIEDFRETCPVVEGELQYSFRGCFVSAAGIKRANRDAENLVDCAERSAAAADIMGKQKYPSEAVEQLWRDVLFNHFHDILPGSSIETVCDEALDHLGRVRHEAREITNNSILPVFLDINTSAYPGTPVMFFNPQGIPYSGPAEVEWHLDYRPLSSGKGPRIVKHILAVDSGGRACPVQFLPTEMVSDGEWRVRGCMEIEVPACGYAVYWLQRAEENIPVAGGVQAGESNIWIANEHIHVEYRAGEDGIRAADKEGNIEWTDGPAGAGLVMEDSGDSWGAGINSWNKLRGKFRIKEAYLLERGPLKASFMIVGYYKNSRLSQEFSIYKGSRDIRCKARLLWNEPMSLCKLNFPIKAGSAFFSAPYAVVERSAGSGECPCGEWARARGDNGQGIGLAHKGQYGFDLTGESLRMSVVRSPWYGSTKAPEKECQPFRPFMDLGNHNFEYIITRPENVPGAARNLNMPVHATLGFPHPGSGPPAQSIISITSGSAQLSALKRAEDGDGWIIRLWEAEGRKTEAEIQVLGKSAGTVKLLPWQLKTLRLFRAGEVLGVREEGLTEIRAQLQTEEGF